MHGIIFRMPAMLHQRSARPPPPLIRYAYGTYKQAGAESASHLRQSGQRLVRVGADVSHGIHVLQHTSFHCCRRAHHGLGLVGQHARQTRWALGIGRLPRRCCLGGGHTNAEEPAAPGQQERSRGNSIGRAGLMRSPIRQQHLRQDEEITIVPIQEIVRLRRHALS